MVEDYVRFVLDDRHLTDLCKQLRHDLTAALGRISIGTSPGRPGDAGRRGHRTDHGCGAKPRRMPPGVLAANFARLQESLRSLEEFGKLLGRRPGGRLQAVALSHLHVAAGRGNHPRQHRAARRGQALRLDRRPAVDRGVRAAGPRVDRGRRRRDSTPRQAAWRSGVARSGPALCAA